MAQAHESSDRASARDMPHVLRQDPPHKMSELGAKEL